jgi:membrane-associated phospholipid phosphatase
MKRLDPAARRAAVASVVVIVVLFLAAAWLAWREDFSDLDHGAKTLVRDGRVLALQRPMRVVGNLATGYVLLPVALVFSAVLWRRRQHAVALALPVIGVTAVAVLGITKWIVNKPRPSLRGYGFPSGHVFAATVFVILVVYLLWLFDMPRATQRLARAVGLVFVVLVGYSRLYVNAHWLSDVVGGLLAGLAFAVVSMVVIDRRLR